MTVMITLSEHSKKILKQLAPLLKDPILQQWIDETKQTLDQTQCIDWLKQPIFHKESTRFLLESLRESLLKDLHDSLFSLPKNSKKNPPSVSNTFDQTKYNALVFSGTLLAICGGFSGITAILALFAVPTAFLFGVGFTFSAVAVAFFYHFDRIEMSKLFGVQLEQPKQLLEVCTEQVKQIKKLRKKIDDKYANTNDIYELQSLLEVVHMLDIRYQGMDDLRKDYTTKLNAPVLKAVKVATGTLKAGLILTTGFLGGQSFALAIASLFVTSIAVTAWPIVTTSALLSLSALSVYYYVQRKTYENTVSSLLGLNKDKIDAFVGKEEVENQITKLHKLEQRIEEKIAFKFQMNEMFPKNKPLNEACIKAPSDEIETQRTIGFFKQKHSKKQEAPKNPWKMELSA